MPPHVVWIYSGNLTHKMDAATFLVPTREMRNSGWPVTLIAAGDPQQTEIRGVEVLHIPTPNVYLLRQIVFHLRLLKVLYRDWGSIDVLLFHETASPWVFTFGMIAKLIGKQGPLMVMDTRTLPMEPLETATWKDKLRGGFSILMDKLSNNMFDGRTTITMRMAESLHVPPKKLWGIWHSGVELEKFAGAAQARKFPGPGEPIHIIYVGSVHYERNLLTLAKAVCQANTDEHIFTLTIIGDGNSRNELEQFAEEAGKCVQIFPPVPHEEVPAWLSRAHVGALPFPDEEKFRVSSPIKLFEYMAAGMPILATRIVCHTDVIEGDGIAFWAEGSDQKALYEALMQIHTHRDRLAAMGEKAEELAHKWTWESSTHHLMDALEKGIREHKPV